MRRWFLGTFVALGLLLSACGGGDDEGDNTSASREESDGGNEDDSDEGTRGTVPGTGTDSAPEGGEAPAEGDEAAESGDGPSRDDYVTALGESSDPNAPDAAETDCLTNAYIDVVGIERLNAATTPEQVAETGLPSPAELGIQLTAAEGDAFYEAVSQCMDFRELFFGSMAGDPAVSACLDEKVTDEQLKDLIVAMFIQPSDAEPPDSTAIETAISECQALASPASG